ncbi:hypothetical protein [Paraburkholderia sartisoli]|uniref:Uncharacterized protein n=1 Tax=Paraburkholderia sartisoli TaxID=83784 RepID=A0A1H3ZYH2_9BURK|nr:hypothetical protein [Paraburkholderia sartisoli]SEA28720.1 hypothetical protein SAMN05192564_101952 [Paraburkholderia sartisoli]
MNYTRSIEISLIAALIATSLAATTVHATEPTADAASEAELNMTNTASPPPVDLPRGLGDFCFFANLPPAGQKYRVIKRVSIGKNSYGSVTAILPRMAEYAQMRGADAIIEYTGSQRFGFWPWRVVRPVVRGTAVQWTEPKAVDCESIGGTKLSTILSSGQPPAK